jgi:archaellum biogenesis ATPase FlaH
LASFNVEKLFVSKIIQEQDMSEVIDIPSYFLDDADYRSAYEFIRTYYSEIGSVPTQRVFMADFQTAAGSPLKLVEVDEPWEDLRKRLNLQYIKGVLVENLDQFNNAFEDDRIDDAINFLGTTLAKVHTSIPNSRDVDVSQNGSERLQRYLERRNNPGTLVGVPTGFPTIDRATQGLQPGQLVTLTGLAKASKSTLAMKIAMSIQEAGYRVLYLTYEQTVEEQERRLDAYRAGFNDNLLNSGSIDHENWQKLQEAVQETAELPPMMISQDCATLSAISAKAEAFEADVVVIDGVYMLEDEKGEPKGSPAALTNIVSGLKNFAMNKDKCVLAVTQSTPARTKGETLNNDSIMGSRSFIQYSNVVIGIERTENSEMRKMKILLSRSCSPCEIVLLFNYDTGEFLEIEGFDLEDDLDQELIDEEYKQKFTGGF